MQKIYVVIIISLLTFCKAMVMTIPNGIACLTNEREYINCAEYLYKNHGCHNYKEPEDIAKNGCKWGTWVTFPTKILAISLRVGPWKIPEELFRSQDFIAIYKHPGYYWKHVIDYLSNPNIDENYKKIAIYSLENLPYDTYVAFSESCYRLYKQKFLTEELFQMVLSFDFLRIHPIVRAAHYKDVKPVHKSFLHKIQSDVGNTSPIGLLIDKILSGKLAEEWDKKGESPYMDYKNLLPFSIIIHDAHKETEEYMKTWEHAPNPYKPPYFLMIQDHPSYYYTVGIELCETDVAGFLRNPATSSIEKRLAIFAMQKLSFDSGEFYSVLIESVCDFYYWDQVSVHVMEDLLHCSFPTFYKYPLFILHYKNESVRRALDKFRAIPTLPCGLKEMALKIKDGKLATSKEMAYMEEYRKLIQTHFTLYETIPPRKDFIN